MTIGVLKEPQEESRVSLLPEAVAALIKKGHSVMVESNAGTRAFAADSDYEKAGASISQTNEVINASDILLAIHQPMASIPSGKVLIGV